MTHDFPALSRIAVVAGVAATLLLAGPARTDPPAPLDQLRATLHELDTSAAVNGVLDVKSDTTQGKGDSATRHSAELELLVHAQEGLGIDYPAALLRKVKSERQAHASDPGQPAPTADLLGQVRAYQVQQTVTAAPRLLRMLAHAESPVVTRVQLDGSAVRKMDMVLPKPKAGDNAFAKLEDYAGSATVWIDSAGMPVAYSTLFKGKFCKFFMCMAIHQSESGTLRVVDGRLVAVKRIEQQQQSGLGQDSQSKTVYTMKVAPGAPPAAGAG